MSNVDDLLDRLDARKGRAHGAARAHSNFTRRQPPLRTPALHGDAFSTPDGFSSHDAFSAHDAFAAGRGEEFSAPVLPDFGDQEAYATPSSASRVRKEGDHQVLIPQHRPQQFVGPTFDDDNSQSYPAQQLQLPHRRLSAQHAAAPYAPSSSPVPHSSRHHLPSLSVGPLPPSPDSPYGNDTALRATAPGSAQERKPSLAQKTQLKIETDEEDEFGIADNDEWMSQAVAEATKVEGTCRACFSCLTPLQLLDRSRVPAPRQRTSINLPLKLTRPSYAHLHAHAPRRPTSINQRSPHALPPPSRARRLDLQQLLRVLSTCASPSCLRAPHQRLRPHAEPRLHASSGAARHRPTSPPVRLERMGALWRRASSLFLSMPLVSVTHFPRSLLITIQTLLKNASYSTSSTSTKCRAQSFTLHTRKMRTSSLLPPLDQARRRSLSWPSST